MLLLAVGVAGCSAVGDTVDKLNPFAAAPKTPLPQLAAIQPTATLRVLWQANAGSSGDFVLSPAVVGKTVYAANRDGAIVRLDDGREVWRVAAGVPISGGVGADERLVVVGTIKGEVLAFDAATGKALWKAATSAEVLGAPAVGEGLVVVRAGDSRIYAFEATDGRRRWLYQRSTPALTLRSNVGVLITERGVVAGFPGGKLAAVSLGNGAALWEATVALPKGTTELERIADITSTPMVAGRVVCAVAYQGRVACLEPGSGSPLWAKDLSSRTGVDIDERNLYVSDDKGNVFAFDRETGSSIWKQDKLAARGLSRPLALGSRVVVADGQGIVHLLRRDDGAFAARLSTDGSAILADPQRIPGGFLVQTRNGGLYALAVE